MTIIDVVPFRIIILVEYLWFVMETKDIDQLWNSCGINIGY